MWVWVSVKSNCANKFVESATPHTWFSHVQFVRCFKFSPFEEFGRNCGHRLCVCTAVLDTVQAAGENGVAIGQIERKLPSMSQGDIRKTLNGLRDAGLVSTTGIKRGTRWVPVNAE